MGNKAKLIWPSVAEELQASAERRRLQRDREARTKARASGSQSSSTANGTSSKSKKTERHKPNNDGPNRAKKRKSRTGSPDENSQPSTDKNGTPKLKQQTLSHFFGLNVKNSAPTPIPPTKQRQQQNQPMPSNQLQRKYSSSSSSPSIIEMSSTAATSAAALTASPTRRPMLLSKQSDRLPKSGANLGMERTEPEQKRRKKDVEHTKKLRKHSNNDNSKKLNDVKNNKMGKLPPQPSSSASVQMLLAVTSDGGGMAVPKTTAGKQSSSSLALAPCWNGLPMTQQQQQLPQSAEQRAEAERRRVKRFVDRLKKSLNELDRESFAKQLVFTAVRLDSDSAGKIENEFLRYMVRIELAKKEKENKIRDIPKAARKEFRRNFVHTKMPSANPHFDHLLAAFKEGKYEDMAVLEPPERRNKFVALCPVLADRPQLAQHFGRALALTQFIHVHGSLLCKYISKCSRPSAEKLLTSMADGLAGYSACVEPVLRLLTSILVDVCKVKVQKQKAVVQQPTPPPLPPTSVRSLRSRDIKHQLQQQTVPVVAPEPNMMDLVKALLKGDNDAMANADDATTTTTTKNLISPDQQLKETKGRRPMVRALDEEEENAGGDQSGGGEGEDVDDAGEEQKKMKVEEEQDLANRRKRSSFGDSLYNVRAELEGDGVCHFYQLSVQAQLAILEHVAKRVQSATVFHDHLKEHGIDEQHEAEQLKAALEQNLSDHRAQLVQLEKEIADNNVDDLAMLTRRQSSNHSADLKKYNTLKLDIDAIVQQLNAMDKRCRILKINNKYRVVPLGQDRFHRLYWFFAGSADGQALFVQQRSCPSCAHSLEKKIDDNNDDNDEQFMRRLTENVEGRPCCCCAVMEEHWWHIRCRAELAELLDTLTARGLREHRLKRQLKAYRDLIEAGMMATIKAVATDTEAGRDGTVTPENTEKTTKERRDVDEAESTETTKERRELDEADSNTTETTKEQRDKGSEREPDHTAAAAAKHSEHEKKETTTNSNNDSALSTDNGDDDDDILVLSLD
uniref:WSD domain-containing protein n=1 Tax=Globodera pallida TaxID=36090 RepID=A0A183CE12_GLOPA